MGSGDQPSSSELHRKSLYLLTHFASPLLFGLLVAPAREGRYFSPKKSQLWGRLSQECTFACPPPSVLFWKWIISATCLSDFFNLLLASGTLRARGKLGVCCYGILFLNQTRSKNLRVLSRKNVVKVLVFYTIWLDMWSVRFSCYRILDLFSSWD